MRSPDVVAGVAILLAGVAWVIGPFAVAGTLQWWPGWRYLVTLGLGLAIHRAVVHRLNPGLREARRRIGEGTPGWDVAWAVAFWWLMAAIPMVAAAGHRTGAAALPGWAWAAGVVVLAGGFGLSAAAMAVNPFFEGTVRVQPERGQRVVETGPYAAVRHPGYLGLCLWAAATPLLLRSSRAFWVAGLTVAWVVVRTALEDRLLRRALSGYEAYARRVRWRLLPGAW